MIFRIDDVSQNTDMTELQDIVKVILERFPYAEIWYCVNPICKTSFDGSVYPGVPFKDRENLFFYNVNASFSDERVWRLKTSGKIVSHGLLHADHSRLQYDAQEMSIVTSCNLLNTAIFVPPFNRWNQVTEAVCRINNIRLVKPEDGWKSLEHEEFNDKHKLWYFHPWKWSANWFKEKLGPINRQFQDHFDFSA